MAAMRPAREAGLRPAGACGFPVDPSHAAGVAAVFWRPEIAPAIVVRLAVAPPEGALGLNLAGLDAWRRTAEDGLHLRLALGPQLLLPAGVDPTAPLAAILPLDEHFRVRAGAAGALYIALKTGARPADCLSSQRRGRLRRMLRALDGRGSGASYRDVAEHVLGMRPADSASWRTASVRDVAVRLCRGAVRLMRGGYLAFLRRGP